MKNEYRNSLTTIERDIITQLISKTLSSHILWESTWEVKKANLHISDDFELFSRDSLSHPDKSYTCTYVFIHRGTGLKITEDVYVQDMNNAPSKREMVNNLLIMLEVAIRDTIQLTRKTRHEELGEILDIIKSL